jgi:phage repressor protein C with HTH and peptisase S24 domain
LSDLLARIPNMAEFSRVSGVHRRMLDRYKAGAEPSLDNAARIAAALNLPLDALVQDVDVTMTERQLDISVPEIALIPLLNVVGSAGAGVENGHVEELALLSFDATQLRRLGVRPEAAHFIIARGDSMEPTIQDGATVLIDASRTRVRDDGIYAIVVDGDVRLKRVQKKATGAIELISDNPRYMSETLSGDEVDRLMVAGKVFWSGGGV